MAPLRVRQVPFALEKREGVLIAVNDAEGIDFLFEGGGIEPLAPDPARDGVREPLQDDLGAVLVTEPVLQHLELQGPDGAQDRIAQASVGQGEHLDRPLLRELLEPLFELLALEGVLAPEPGEDLWREAG